MTDSQKIIAKELNLAEKNVAAVLDLLAEGATVPFIARYRKEATGSLDEVAITDIRDKFEALNALNKRREAIVSALTEREQLTDELSQALQNAATLSELEDIYLPYKPKRRTKAQVARERGLEPLANLIFEQDSCKLESLAATYVSEENDVPDMQAALQGARDIIAERISEDTQTRTVFRKIFAVKGVCSSKLARGKKEEEAATFKDYLNWEEPIVKAPGHRLLAMFRGEQEGLLSLSIRPDEGMALNALRNHFVASKNDCGKQVLLACEDAYKRLLAPSLENDIRNELKTRADIEAISVFAANLRELLLAAPLGQKRVLALDPGYRTGAKLVCLSEHGDLLHNETIFPTSGAAKEAQAGERVQALVKKFAIETIAIGNGTASRETETFVRNLNMPNVTVNMVNESGASVYSASAVAREEFPDQDITVRGAVSIGRRLMDPLAELVKIDPKSIGVGQYQHDVNQVELKKALDDVVASCVNSVGVELNTASKELLTHVSGLGPVLAQNIITYRAENGAFASRKELLKVPRLGPKAFQQCAGFLRIHDATNPLDASAVHPESYKVVEQIAKDLASSLPDLIGKTDLSSKVSLPKYVTETVGLPTLNDIMNELARPGRDPREQFTEFSFADVHAISDLYEGMTLPGIVTNVTKFGAFVDVGVHQDGLVHISQLADRYVSDPSEVVRVQQKVHVKVLEVDVQRKRISLSMKDAAN
ncbi:Tex family protein [Halodesulfovibrio spirochaetisodalis]|uniref:Transcription accessory protein n=1 Tax=Halodesulfovibrio spirochaetisodalis TaxID=1560234 RepID=A0A1B7X8W2_9BACT|nr:Tex family protein [Halodesulfovibrio spirochaetisodalis]OBQ45815.1 transcription accessory protein [Halodesulfovibrio spirochaetisodalis]